jgi:hypothetical protein
VQCCCCVTVCKKQPHDSKMRSTFIQSVALLCTGSLKLAGTALTLLGGLATWLSERPHTLPAVLPAVSAALRSPDDKLSRNAATCAQRLASCDGLAVLLAQGQPQFVQQLLQEYQRRGGLATRAGVCCCCCWSAPCCIAVLLPLLVFVVVLKACATLSFFFDTA